MNALYISFNGFSKHSGISRKKTAQVKGLKECGLHVFNCYYTTISNDHRIWMVDNEVLTDFGKGILAKIKKTVCYTPIIQYAINNHIDFIYIRHDFNANPFLIYTAKFLSKRGIKLFLEIPTFPYDNEFKYSSWIYKLELIIDRLFRIKYASYIYKIVTFTNKKFIWKRPTIQISNGIDFDEIKLKETKHKTSENLTIHFIAVAEIHNWHAYDRLIIGLGEYYKGDSTKENILFHIVGGLGPIECKLYNSLILKYNISQHVIFHGPLYGNELDKLFDLADIGIGSLGRHRSKITYIKTLKNREYAARGIPFIYSEIDEDFEKMPYIMKVPADESPINIKQIIDFYEGLHVSPEEIRNSILFLSWKEQMRKIIKEV